MRGHPTTGAAFAPYPALRERHAVKERDCQHPGDERQRDQRHERTQCPELTAPAAAATRRWSTTAIAEKRHCRNGDADVREQRKEQRGNKGDRDARFAQPGPREHQQGKDDRERDFARRIREITPRKKQKRHGHCPGKKCRARPGNRAACHPPRDETDEYDACGIEQLRAERQQGSMVGRGGERREQQIRGGWVWHRAARCIERGNFLIPLAPHYHILEAMDMEGQVADDGGGMP